MLILLLLMSGCFLHDLNYEDKARWEGYASSADMIRAQKAREEARQRARMGDARWRAAQRAQEEALEREEKREGISQAIKEGGSERLVSLLNSSNINELAHLDGSISEYGIYGSDMAPIHEAVMLGNEETARTLIKNKAGLDVKTEGDKGGYTALMLAVMKGYLGLCRLLLDEGSDVDARDAEGNTALMISVTRTPIGFGEEMCELLLDKGSNVNAKNSKGDTALMLAVDKWNADKLLPMLLARRIEVNAKNSEGRTALMSLICSNRARTGVLEPLLNKGSSVNAKDSNGQTALMLAAIRGDEETCKLLLDRGSKVNAEDLNGNTAFMLAVANCFPGMYGTVLRMQVKQGLKQRRGDTEYELEGIERRERVCSLLLDKGSKIDAKDSMGRTALMLAAVRGNGGMCEFLLDRGSDIDAKDVNGNTVLMLIIESGEHREVLELLLARKSEINAKDTSGCTALMHAAMMGFNEKYIPQKDVCEILLNGGSEVNAKDVAGRTALMYVAMGLHKEDKCELLLAKESEINAKYSEDRHGLMVDAAWLDKKGYRGEWRDTFKLLLDRGSEVNAEAADGRTALMFAAMGLYGEDACEMLLDRGSKVNDKDAAGRTALMLAAMRGWSENVCKLLLERGGEVNAKDVDNRTALMLAAIEGHERICALLLRSGADLDIMDKSGRTALTWAIVKGHSALAIDFVKEGATIGQNSLAGLKQLRRLYDQSCVEKILLGKVFDSLFDDYSEVCQFLSVKFAIENPIENMNRKGYMSIHFAAISSDDKLLKELLAYDWVLDSIDNAENTDALSPLRLALKYNRLQNAKLLLAHGASPVYQTLLGRNDILKSNKELSSYIAHEALFELLRLGRVGMAKNLILKSFDCASKRRLDYKNIVNLGALDEMGRNVYHYLALFCHEDIALSEFLNRSFELKSFKRELLNQYDSEGNTPLQLAVLSSNQYFVEHLAAGKLTRAEMNVRSPKNKRNLVDIVLAGLCDAETNSAVIKHVLKRESSERENIHDVLMGRDEEHKLFRLKQFMDEGGNLFESTKEGFSVLEDILATDDHNLLNYATQHMSSELLEKVFLKTVNLSSPACLEFLYSILKDDVRVSVSKKIDIHQLCREDKVESLKVVLRFMRDRLIERNSDGEMPIHVAAKRARVGVVELLLSYGEVIDHLDAKNKYGQNLMHCAVVGFSPAIISLFFEKGCQTLLDKDGNGRRPLDLVRDLLPRNEEERSKRIGVIYALLSLSCGVEYDPDDYERAVILAVKLGEVHMVKELLREGYGSYRDEEENSVLHSAVMNDNSEAVRAILSFSRECMPLNIKKKLPLCFVSSVGVLREYFNGAMGVDIDSSTLLNQINEIGDNILQVTVRRSDEFSKRAILESLIGYMLDNGADREHLNREEGLAAADLAAKFIDREMREMILKHAPDFREMEERIRRREEEKIAEQLRRPAMDISRILNKELEPNAFIGKEKNMRALHYVVVNNDFSSVCKLLGLGADPRLGDKEGNSVYRLAAGCSPLIFGQLMEFNRYKDLAFVDAKGESVMQIALSKGGEVERIALEAMERQKLEIPLLLFTAVDFKRTEAIDKLLRLGLNVRTRTQGGKSILRYVIDLAEDADHRGIYEKDKFQQCFRRVLNGIKRAADFEFVVFSHDNDHESAIGRALSVSSHFYLSEILNASSEILGQDRQSKFTKEEFYTKLGVETKDRIKSLLERQDHLMLLLNKYGGMPNLLSCGEEDIFAKAIYLAAERKNRDAVRIMIASFVEFRSRSEIQYEKVKGYISIILQPLCAAFGLGVVGSVLEKLLSPKLEEKYEAIRFIDRIYKEGEWAMYLGISSLRKLLEYYVQAAENLKEMDREKLERRMAHKEQQDEERFQAASGASAVLKVARMALMAGMVKVQSLIDSVKEEFELDNKPITEILLKLEEPEIFSQDTRIRFRETRQEMCNRVLNLVDEYNITHKEYSDFVVKNIVPVMKLKLKWTSDIGQNLKRSYEALIKKRRELKNSLYDYIECSSKVYRELEDSKAMAS